MSLQGIDVSSYQSAATLNAWLPKIGFGIVKATEGVSYVSSVRSSQAAALRAAGKLVGFYHYAHLVNSPAAEANFFVSNAHAQPGDVLVLDFEPYGQNISTSRYPAWIVTFLQTVGSLTGAPCWIYLNDDMASQVVAHATGAQLAVIRKAPLWKARYASSAGSLYGWPALTAWQHTSSPLDEDTFYGDADTWRALAVPGKKPNPPKEWYMSDIPKAQLDQIGAAVVSALAGADIWPAPEPTKDNPNWRMSSYLKYTYLNALAAKTAAQAAANPTAVASALAPLLAKLLPPSGAPSVADLETALRNVLGSLDDDGATK